MTLTPELERFVNGPAPYSSGNPVPSAEGELSAALEGQAPTLAREVAGLLGPVRTVKLAQAIGRAVAVGINRRGEQRTAEIVAGAYDLMVQGLDQVTAGSTTPEAEAEWTCAEPNPSGTTGCAREEGHHGDHQTASGETWPQAAARG